MLGGRHMESRVIRIPSKVNSNVVLRVIPGHFATTHSHINYYVDMTFLKSRKSEESKLPFSIYRLILAIAMTGLFILGITYFSSFFNIIL